MLTKPYPLGFTPQRETRSTTAKAPWSLGLALPLWLVLGCLSRPAVAADGPVVTVARVTTAIPGATGIQIPVTTTGFTNIGMFILTLRFDITMVTFVSATTNPLLSGMTVTYLPAGSDNRAGLVLAWNSLSNVSLTDGSSLVNLTFDYINYSGIISLSYLYPDACRFKRWVSGSLTVLNIIPEYNFLLYGGIADHGAPVTYAPLILNPVPGALSIPITVTGFTNIGSISLSLEYDPAVITFQNTFTKNPIFNAAFGVSDNVGSGGKKYISIGWYGNSVNLTDGATMVTLNFTYLTAGTNCALHWLNNNASSEYTDDMATSLIDLPTPTYYKDGAVGLPLVHSLRITNAAPGFATISWTLPSSGFVLQETLNLSPTNWNNAPSGPTNPVTVPTTGPARFYRLLQTGP